VLVVVAVFVVVVGFMDSYDDAPNVLVLVVREEEVSNDDAYEDAPEVLVLVVREVVSDDAFDDPTDDCAFVEVVSLATVVLGRDADVKILELVVLVLVVREDADAAEDVIKDA
jgi:hypothetical protein